MILDKKTFGSKKKFNFNKDLNEIIKRKEILHPNSFFLKNKDKFKKEITKSHSQILQKEHSTLSSSINIQKNPIEKFYGVQPQRHTIINKFPAKIYENSPNTQNTDNTLNSTYFEKSDIIIKAAIKSEKNYKSTPPLDSTTAETNFQNDRNNLTSRTNGDFNNLHSNTSPIKYEINKSFE